MSFLTVNTTQTAGGSSVKFPTFLKPVAVKRLNGFTLLELVVTMAIVALLAAIAVPSFQTLLARRHLNQVTSDLEHGIYLARSEAVKRSAPVLIQPAGESGWSTGWQVIADTNGDGSYTDAPLFVGERIHGDVVVSETDENQLTADHLTFSALGSVTPLGDRLALNFRDTDCDVGAILLTVHSSGEVVKGETACTTD